MQSSEATVSETSAAYCQALLNAGGTTADDAAKPLAVATSQRRVQAHPTSHLVTNRSYTASKLTSDYVSEMPTEKPSELTGTVPHAKLELESHLRLAVGDNRTREMRDIPNVDSASDKVEYVCFIHPSDNSSHSASTSDTVRKEELARLQRQQRCSRDATSTNDDVLYDEIKDNDEVCEHYTDVLVPGSGHSAVARENIVVERDSLLQRVSRLTSDKQEMVYKLRAFVETNAKLHAELEQAHAAIVNLQSKLHEVELTLESERREKAVLNSRLVEQTSQRISSSNRLYVNQEQTASNSRKQTVEGVVASAGNDFVSSVRCVR